MYYNIQYCALSPIFNIFDIYAFKPPIADVIVGTRVSQGVDV